jgi:hypothetical protein
VAAPATGTNETAVDLPQLWQTVVEAVGRASAFTKSYLTEAFPVSLAKGVLTIGFDPEFADQMELVNNSRTITLLQTKLQELGHPGLQVKFTKAEAPALRAPKPVAAAAAPAAPAVPPTAQPAATAAKRAAPAPEKLSADEFKNDPLIQKALEMFKGQIVEARG